LAVVKKEWQISVVLLKGKAGSLIISLNYQRFNERFPEEKTPFLKPSSGEATKLGMKTKQERYMPVPGKADNKNKVISSQVTGCD